MVTFLDATVGDVVMPIRLPLNLDPPPGFRGLDPVSAFQMYRRRLPHWRQPGATYFVTCCLADALPRNRQNELRSMRRHWEGRNPGRCSEKDWLQFAKQEFRAVENWMDLGYGQCWFQIPEYADRLAQSIEKFNRIRYHVGCGVIMANHFHLIIRPYQGIRLEQELGGIKSATARFIHQREGSSGPLWRQESYDRIVRDEEHLYRAVQYIGSNPQRAGIPRSEWRRWVDPDWEAQRWGFREP